MSLILFKTQITLLLVYLAKDYATTGHFPLYPVLQFSETSSNLAAAQAAKTMLRPPSAVAPFTSLLDSHRHIPDEYQSEWKTT